MKKLNKKLAAGIGLGALAVVGGTFAYYNQSASLDNPLSTGKYQNQLVEDFTPPTEDLKPGQKWEKKVGAENTGDYPVLVRVKMEENWSRKGDAIEAAYKTLKSIDNYTLFNNGVYDENTGIFDAAQDKDDDGLTPAADGTVVYKDLKLADGWVDGGDGYWYWNGVLEKKGSDKSKTTNLMENLIMATDIDLGLYETTEYYAIAAVEPAADDGNAWQTLPSITDVNEDGVVDIRDYVYSKDGAAPMINVPEGQKMFRRSESKINSSALGYSDSNYTLTITSEFVQATKDAVNDSWGGDTKSFDFSKIPAVNVGDVDLTN
ncbi:BsaA family SipW-dependent biofilm matrix protein [Lachnospiraceae bacterium 62-35]